jgi:hypothetical protein
MVAGGVVVAGIVAAVIALTQLNAGHGSAVDASRLGSAGVQAPPAPPRGAVVLAGEAGDRAVALAVGRGRRPRLTATVLAGTGGGDSGLRVSFRLGGETVRAMPCGDGCYAALAPAGASTRRVDVLLPKREVAFRLPASVSPGAAIVGRASRVFRGLRSLVYVETLRSGPTGGITTTWRLAAPNRVEYQIHGGASAIVVGTRRWDRGDPSARWTQSQQLPALRVPEPSWGSVTTNAYLLGTGRVRGHRVWIVSFANPTVPAWFTAWIDRGSYRTLQLRMTAAAHFMFHRYLEFDRPLRIAPPTRSRG